MLSATKGFSDPLTRSIVSRAPVLKRRARPSIGRLITDFIGDLPVSLEEPLRHHATAEGLDVRNNPAAAERCLSLSRLAYGPADSIDVAPGMRCVQMACRGGRGGLRAEAHRLGVHPPRAAALMLL